MKGFVCALTLGLLLLGLSAAKEASPKVQVYTRLPGEFGKSNVFICHVTDFHPPEIKIELLKNGQVIPGAQQTDLAFEESWHYHLTKHVAVTPMQGDDLACRVTHMKNTKTYTWESDL
ncbi:hypothetical protein Q5P01_003316 [Channa striata]|uniref:Beta-2-microglobulin n=1 Tax=Channa striata TaxID=64152 RepID=A0AA88NM99_CHASR|nr:hypothetical protein Q5P01_003316 [Channa striata]